MRFYNTTKQVLLCICDGMGYSDNTNKNAVRDANTPNLDKIYKTYPFTTIIPGGEKVGLPDGVAGNSEVGHMNLGAGRPVRQDLVRINEAIDNDTLKDMEGLKKIISYAKENGYRIHLMGLLSDGGVHSHIDHFKAVLKILKSEGLDIFYHAFMDGRDTPKTNGVRYIQDVQEVGGFTFASMQGRSIGMDRDRRWEKIKTAYDMMTGQSGVKNEKPDDYILNEYDKDIYDEFITPALFSENGAIKNGDAVYFLNFRPDRARQISLAFCKKDFSEFDVPVRPGYYLCMSPYIDEECPEVPILFDREKIPGTLSEYLSQNGHKQLKIAETEKYAHVTYFFNGGAEKPFEGEERILIDSPKEVATYDQKPEMSAYKVLEQLERKLDEQNISLFVVNFANPDMVGHTGNYEAAIKAMEVVDECVGKLKDKCLQNGITMLITADHGNCDEMVYPDGTPQTSHSKANVPFALVQKDWENGGVESHAKEQYALMDVAPTILHLLGLKNHPEMTGKSIFE